jgi:hypothetical protein
MYGLIGRLRVGKDAVANFLTENRNFTQMAFADQIKDEFGISKEDFEAAKIAGNIEELRNKLWNFSAEKKKNNSRYFIDKVINRAEVSKNSIIITDIRTPEEFQAFSDINAILKRIYWVKCECLEDFDRNGYLVGSKLPKNMIIEFMKHKKSQLRYIYNNKNGLYNFYKYLDKFFFAEDLIDLYNHPEYENNIHLYIDNFEVRQKGI